MSCRIVTFTETLRKKQILKYLSWFSPSVCQQRHQIFFKVFDYVLDMLTAAHKSQSNCFFYLFFYTDLKPDLSLHQQLRIKRQIRTPAFLYTVYDLPGVCVLLTAAGSLQKLLINLTKPQRRQTSRIPILLHKIAMHAELAARGSSVLGDASPPQPTSERLLYYIVWRFLRQGYGPTMESDRAHSNVVWLQM